MPSKKRFDDYIIKHNEGIKEKWQDKMRTKQIRKQRRQKVTGERSVD
ncbi:MAG: hypothetical protein KKD07_01585 [Candidatus Omnitrophica bacterium]|nr:hypothetical protein [Candidatus Omnitrophota bacterium]MBU1997353.1 hypothetical protein [Candidatus Omnitrophota bacterium]MBU4333113.1 hypothetical protein [Candidatus Omnitrophota bacterium]